MTREEAWQRHLVRVQRLRAAPRKREEALAIKAELMAAGYDQNTSERIVRESWNYAKTKGGK